jgi:hypothetical protein
MDMNLQKKQKIMLADLQTGKSMVEFLCRAKLIKRCHCEPPMVFRRRSNLLFSGI